MQQQSLDENSSSSAVKAQLKCCLVMVEGPSSLTTKHQHYKLLSEFWMYFSSIPGTRWRRDLSTAQQPSCAAGCPCHSSSLPAQTRHSPSLTCCSSQRTGRIQGRLISANPSDNQIHFSGHQEFLTGVLGLFQGQQLCDALPQVLPRGKTD